MLHQVCNQLVRQLRGEVVLSGTVGLLEEIDQLLLSPGERAGHLAELVGPRILQEYLALDPVSSGARRGQVRCEPLPGFRDKGPYGTERRFEGLEQLLSEVTIFPG